MIVYNGRITGTSILTFLVLVEFIHRGYPVTGYKGQDTGIVTQIHFMRLGMDFQTAPVTHGEDSGRSAYSRDRITFPHFRPEMLGSGGEQCRVIAPGKHHS